jgi:hypothetical protein
LVKRRLEPGLLSKAGEKIQKWKLIEQVEQDLLLFAGPLH